MPTVSRQSDADPSEGAVGASAEPGLVLERCFWRAVGARGAPTLVVIGGVHGNEPAGIHAARRVLARLGLLGPGAMRGSLVALAGDIAAINHHDPDTRYIDHDLNRLCRPEYFAEPPETSAEHAQMHELFGALGVEHERARTRGDRMIVVDLHTTSAPSRPFVTMEDSLPARAVVRHLPLPRYLGMEEELGGLVFDAATQRFGCVSFLIEGGQHDDPVSVDMHEAAIWTLLRGLGMVERDASRGAPLGGEPEAWLRRAAGPTASCAYDLRHREPITHPDFTIVDGIVTGASARAGRTRIAIQNGRTLVAPLDGEIFLPNMQPYKRPGDDGYFIVRRVGAGWINLSARLRTKRTLHAIIERLPGVHAHDSGVLLVDADLAAVLKRQIFHLLGYRLVRHDDRIGASGAARLRRGLAAFARAIERGPRRAPLDPDDPAFWVVRRRRLDLDAERGGPPA